MLNFVYCFATSALDWMGQEPILQLMVAMLLMEHARSMDVFFFVFEFTEEENIYLQYDFEQNVSLCLFELMMT